MMPERTGLVIAQDRDSIIEPAPLEMQFLTIDEGGQTDPRIADGSERYEPRLAVTIPLCGMMVEELRHRER